MKDPLSLFNPARIGFWRTLRLMCTTRGLEDPAENFDFGKSACQPVAVRVPAKLAFWDQDPVALKLNTMQYIVVDAMRKYELKTFGYERGDRQWRVTARNDADLYDITISLRSLDERFRQQQQREKRDYWFATAVFLLLVEFLRFLGQL